MMSDTKIWRMLTGEENGKHEDQFLSTGKIYMCIDKSNFDCAKIDRSEIQKRLEDNRPGGSHLGHYAGFLHRFASEMRIGDYILLSLMKSKPRKINIGIIIGDYEYDSEEEEPYWHSRKVIWLEEYFPFDDVPVGEFREGFKSRDALHQFSAIEEGLEWLRQFKLPDLMKEQELYEKEVKEEVKKLERERQKKENKPIPVPEGEESPKERLVVVKAISRNPRVKAYLLNNAKGICECCDQKAPFNTEDGNPYLEIHHLKMLADGGSDTIQNAVAVCPNCHRELHYGKNRERLLESLYQTIDRLEME